MTVSRLPWMNCAAANSRTKSYWTGPSSWDWGRTWHGESYDSFGDLAGPEVQQPTTATTAALDAGFNRRCPTSRGPPLSGQSAIRCGVVTITRTITVPAGVFAPGHLGELNR